MELDSKRDGEPKAQESDAAAEEKKVGKAKAPPMQAADPLCAAVAAVAVVAFVLASFSTEQMPDSAGPWLLNPTGTHIGTFLGMYVLSVLGKAMLSAFMGWLGHSFLEWPRMDVGGGDKVKRLEVLQFLDICFLGLATVAEFIGMNHLVAVLSGEDVQFRLKDFNLTNGPLAFIVVVVVNDAIQYPFHVICQSRIIFPFCHKQHRRQLIPFRGYADAANKHPIEVFASFAALTTSLQLTSEYVGLHLGAALMVVCGSAILDILHHLPFDIHAHLPVPFPVKARHHQTHHRLRKCNHGTLTSLFDHLGGTWEEYHALDEPEPEPPRELMWYEKSVDPAEPEPEEPGPFSKVGRPDLFPSPISIGVAMVILVLVTIVLEVHYITDLPNWHDVLPFARPLIVVFNVGLFCVAVEHACATEVEPKKKKTRIYTKPTMREAAGIKEAVRPGHHKKMTGGKDVWLPKLNDAVSPKIVKRE